MRILLFLIWLIFPLCQISGQSQEALAEWKRLFSASEREFDLGNYGSAHNLIDSFLALRLEETILLTKGLILKAEILANEGDYVSAREVLDQSLAITSTFSNHSSRIGEGLTQLAYAQVYYQEGDYEEAIEAASESILSFENEEDFLEPIKIQLESHLRLKDYESARNTIESGLIISKSKQESLFFFSFVSLVKRNGFEIDYDKIRKFRSQEEGLAPNQIVVVSILIAGGLAILFFIIRSTNLSNTTPSIDQSDDNNILVEKNTKEELDEAVLSLIISQRRKEYAFKKAGKVAGSNIMMVSNSADTGYPKLYLKNGQIINLTQKPTLKRIAESELLPPLFYKINRSTIINLSEVDRDAVLKDRTFITMSDGSKASVPESKWKEFYTYYIKIFDNHAKHSEEDLSKEEQNLS